MELTNQASEFDPQPMAPQPLLQGPLAALLAWQAMAEGAYSANTLRAQKADGAIFQAFCEAARRVRICRRTRRPSGNSLKIEVTAGKKPATVKRYVATIARVAHRRGVVESLLERGGAVGTEEDGPGDLGPTGPGAPAGLEGHQGIHRDAPAKACEPIVSEHCSAWPMRPLRDAESSWHSRCEN